MQNTLVNMSDISLACSSLNLHEGELRLDFMVGGRVTYISIIVFPKPYHNPPAPTKFDRRTLHASALSAFRTLEANGGGILNSAQSLFKERQCLPNIGNSRKRKRINDSISKPDGNLDFA